MRRPTPPGDSVRDKQACAYLAFARWATAMQLARFLVPEGGQETQKRAGRRVAQRLQAAGAIERVDASLAGGSARAYWQLTETGALIGASAVREAGVLDFERGAPSPPGPWSAIAHQDMLQEVILSLRRLVPAEEVLRALGAGFTEAVLLRGSGVRPDLVLSMGRLWLVEVDNATERERAAWGTKAAKYGELAPHLKERGLGVLVVGSARVGPGRLQTLSDAMAKAAGAHSRVLQGPYRYAGEVLRLGDAMGNVSPDIEGFLLTRRAMAFGTGGWERAAPVGDVGAWRHKDGRVLLGVWPGSPASLGRLRQAASKVAHAVGVERIGVFALPWGDTDDLPRGGEGTPVGPKMTEVVTAEDIWPLAHTWYRTHFRRQAHKEG